MGFNIIIKLIKEALGIIIIVAAVILFSWFDPFGWFESKPKIQGTAILVREVKAIGELITAEYYGEALTSWPDVFGQSLFEEDSLAIQGILDGIGNELEAGNPGEKDNNGKLKAWDPHDVWKYYKKHVREHYEKSELYDFIIAEVAKRTTTNRFNREKKAILEIYKSSEDEIFKTSQFEAISKLHFKELSRAERRKDAICIGRGIVRAGIDLSQVKDTDVTIFEYSKTAYISNATVKIIAVEMNPWFIPQRKVKGFEILKLKGKINGDDIHKLKAKCKELIEKQANDRHIVDDAKKNAEEALLSFFNLIRKEPLDRVYILTDPLDELHIKFDSLKYLSPPMAAELFNKSYLYINSHVPGDTSMFMEEKKSLKDLITKTRKKMIMFPAENKNTKSIDLKQAKLAADHYNIVALMQHFKIAYAPDTVKERKEREKAKAKVNEKEKEEKEEEETLGEMDYLNQYWADSIPKKTNIFSQDTLANRKRKIEAIFKTGL